MIKVFTTRYLLLHCIFLGVIGLLFAHSGQHSDAEIQKNQVSAVQNLAYGSFIAPTTHGKSSAHHIAHAIPEFEEEDTTSTSRKHLKMGNLLTFIFATLPAGISNPHLKIVSSFYGHPYFIPSQRQHLLIQVFRI